MSRLVPPLFLFGFDAEKAKRLIFSRRARVARVCFSLPRRGGLSAIVVVGNLASVFLGGRRGFRLLSVRLLEPPAQIQLPPPRDRLELRATQRDVELEVPEPERHARAVVHQRKGLALRQTHVAHHLAPLRRGVEQHVVQRQDGGVKRQDGGLRLFFFFFRGKKSLLLVVVVVALRNDTARHSAKKFLGEERKRRRLVPVQSLGVRRVGRVQR